MATAMTGPFRNTARAMQMVRRIMIDAAGLQFDAKRQFGSKRPPGKVWYHSADPDLDAGDQVAYPVKQGDYVINTTDDSLHLCAVAPAANTAATFNEVVA